MRSRVDLPAPFGPMSPTLSPSDSVKHTPSKRGRDENDFPRLRAVTRMAMSAGSIGAEGVERRGFSRAFACEPSQLLAEWVVIGARGLGSRERTNGMVAASAGLDGL